MANLIKKKILPIFLTLTMCLTTLMAFTAYAEETGGEVPEPTEQYVTVTFNTLGYSSETPPQQTILSGGYVTKPANPISDTYDFAYWYNLEDASESEFVFENPVYADITLIAKWNEKDKGFPVQFALDENVDSVDVFYGEISTEPDQDNDWFVYYPEEADVTGVKTGIVLSPVSRDASTREPDSKGTGQMIFRVNMKPGYVLDEAKIDGYYTEMTDTWIKVGRDTYDAGKKISGVQSNLYITLTSKEHEHTAGEAVQENVIPAGCETPGSYDSVTYCTECGKELARENIQTEATGHNWDGGVVTRESTCQQEGEITYTCQNDPTHTKTEPIPISAHHADEYIPGKEATCMENGYPEHGVCVYCGQNIDRNGNVISKEDMIIHATGHKAGEMVKENVVAPSCLYDGSHDEVIYCENCDKELSRKNVKDKATGHKWDSGTVTKQASCTEQGVRTYTCLNDKNHTRTEKIEMTAHSPGTTVRENVIKPTCTKNGSHDEVVYCMTCNKEIRRKTIQDKATGHTADKAVQENIVPATCDTPGSYDNVVYCKDCGVEMNRTTVKVPATGHNWDSGKVTTPATCSKEGVKTYTCTRDHTHTKTSPIPKTNHVGGEKVTENVVASTCSKNGSHDEVVYCKECKEEISRETITDPKTAHTPGEAVVENRKPAGCETEGSYDEVIYCKICHEEISRTTHRTPATGHVYDSGTVIKQPTCTTTGSIIYTCKNCGHEQTKTIAAKGHAASAKVRENVKEATCDTEGSYEEVTYCRTCKAEMSRTKKTMAPLGHAWGSWKNAGGDVLYRSCLRDGSHVQVKHEGDPDPDKNDIISVAQANTMINSANRSSRFSTSSTSSGQNLTLGSSSPRLTSTRLGTLPASTSSASTNAGSTATRSGIMSSTLPMSESIDISDNETISALRSTRTMSATSSDDKEEAADTARSTRSATSNSAADSSAQEQQAEDNQGNTSSSTRTKSTSVKSANSNNGSDEKTEEKNTANGSEEKENKQSVSENSDKKSGTSNSTADLNKENQEEKEKQKEEEKTKVYDNGNKDASSDEKKETETSKDQKDQKTTATGKENPTAKENETLSNAGHQGKIEPVTPAQEIAPRSGDESNMTMWIIIGAAALVAAGAAVAIILIRKKKRGNE